MTIKGKTERIKLSLRLPVTLNSDLETLCRKRRGVTKTEIIEKAVNEYLYPEGSDKKEALIGRSLERIEQRLKSIERGNVVLGEALYLFIRVWITSTHELPEDQQDAAKKAAGPRIQKFLDILGKRLQSGKSLFEDLPKDVFFNPEQFFEVGESEVEDD